MNVPWNRRNIFTNANVDGNLLKSSQVVRRAHYFASAKIKRTTSSQSSVAQSSVANFQFRDMLRRWNGVCEFYLNLTKSKTLPVFIKMLQRNRRLCVYYFLLHDIEFSKWNRLNASSIVQTCVNKFHQFLNNFYFVNSDLLYAFETFRSIFFRNCVAFVCLHVASGH